MSQEELNTNKAATQRRFTGDNVERFTRPVFWTTARIANLIAHREDGLSNCEIGRLFGVTEGTISRKVKDLQKMGVQIARRSPGPMAGASQAKPYKTPAEFVPGRKGAETRAQVQDRAKALMRYWHNRGHLTVTAWVELDGSCRDGSPIFSLRSNLVNGLPPRKRAKGGAE